MPGFTSEDFGGASSCRPGSGVNGGILAILLNEFIRGAVNVQVVNRRSAGSRAFVDDVPHFRQDGDSNN